MNFDVSCHVKSGNQEVVTKVVFDTEVDSGSLTDFVEELKHAIEGKSMMEEIQRAWTDRSDMATKRYDAEKRSEELEAERDDWHRRCRESTSQTEGLYKRIKQLESENDLLTQANYKWEQDCDRLTLENQQIRQGNADLIAQVERLEQDSQKLDEVIDYWHSQTLQVREDAELGRLVRAMPFWMLCRHSENSWTMRYGIHVTDYCKLPEEALRAAGVGTEQQETPLEKCIREVEAVEEEMRQQARKEYCPATPDHFCPKADNCIGSVCALSEAVKS